MTHHWAEELKIPSSSVSISNSFPTLPHSTSHASSTVIRNVFQLLARREISPRTKHQAKRLVGRSSKYEADSSGLRCESTDAKLALCSWVESSSLHHLSAKYCPLLPPPRSTIAAAFSPDGKTLASTHGDHTVKIIDYQTGKCLKELSGHRRTPWVVRFHPLHSDILASGSLDHEVRLWDAYTSDCIGSRDFYRPIASIAFHAQGELLAVASGHKLYVWNYNKRGEDSSPAIVLKTRRSLRAVHFHPHGAPFLLTAEVNNIDASDSALSVATSSGYLHYPPAVFIANMNSNSNMHPGSSSSSQHIESRLSASPCLFWPAVIKDDGRISLLPGEWAPPSAAHMQQQNRVTVPSFNPELETQPTPMDIITEDTATAPGPDAPALLRNVETGQYPHFGLTGENLNMPNWELPPFWQGWLLGQTHTNGADNISPQVIYTHDTTGLPNSRVFVGRRVNPNPDPNPTRFHGQVSVGNSSNNMQNEHAEFNPGSIELPTSLLATGTAELPCTVKLRIWQHDVKNPCAPLDQGKCRLTVSHAVLCSEMGAHFSPCGRYLVACVACVMPQMEGETGALLQAQQLDTAGAASSPTRHPFSSHRVIYELRIYSLEEATFGTVLASRAIRAAHCLTSIQFSPTSEHILLAYGRRHTSLLRSIVMDGETAIPIYTILEVYRVSDMELVRVLPSAEDEVNVACFHPSPGGGLVYGTKEGKLRIFQYDGPINSGCGGLNIVEENMLEIQKYALEC